MTRVPVGRERRRYRLGDPVDHDVGQDLIAREGSFDVTSAIRPASILFDDPGGKAYWRVVQTKGQCLRSRLLKVFVGSFIALPLFLLEKVRTLGVTQWWVADSDRPVNIRHMDADH